MVSVFERRARGLYHNTAVILDADGSTRGLYRKMHIPDDPLYYEKFYFTPGDLGFKAFDTEYGRMGALVCWDQWYPEGARLTALQGANILFYPTAIGWHPDEKAEFGTVQHDAWRTIQRAHAIANGVFVGVVNRVGHEFGDIRGNRAQGKGLEFWGGSFLCDPFGRIIVEASHDKEEILIGQCDLNTWKTSAATGLSCATAALTATAASRKGFWTDGARENGARENAGSWNSHATFARLPHARRVGAAPVHLAGLAAQPLLTGRENSTPSPGSLPISSAIWAAWKM